MDINQHLRTYSTPCSRTQGLLRPMVKFAPSLVARDATLSAQLNTIVRLCEWCQLTLNHTNIAATTCDRESKKLMENTQPKRAMHTSTSVLFCKGFHWYSSAIYGSPLNLSILFLKILPNSSFYANAHCLLLS